MVDWWAVVRTVERLLMYMPSFHTGNILQKHNILSQPAGWYWYNPPIFFRFPQCDLYSSMHLSNSTQFYLLSFSIYHHSQDVEPWQPPTWPLLLNFSHFKMFYLWNHTYVIIWDWLYFFGTTQFPQRPIQVVAGINGSLLSTTCFTIHFMKAIWTHSSIWPLQYLGFSPSTGW